MIFGIGTDIVAVARISEALDAHGERFAARILVAMEQAEMQRDAHPARFLAKRFAVKEAFAKAFGTGIGAQVGWHDVQVEHDPHGRPLLGLSQALRERMDSAAVEGAHVSISDEADYVVAFVVLEKRENA
jgi:holo-[acyl-carrier protein] synthase